MNGACALSFVLRIQHGNESFEGSASNARSDEENGSNIDRGRSKNMLFRSEEEDERAKSKRKITVLLDGVRLGQLEVECRLFDVDFARLNNNARKLRLESKGKWKRSTRCGGLFT